MAQAPASKVTRRRFLELSFGMLALSVAGAAAPAFLQRLEQSAAQAGSAEQAEAARGLLSTAQYLQGHPKLAKDAILRDGGGSYTLHTPDADFTLNDSAFLALAMCEGKATVNEICEALSSRFNVLLATIRNDVVALVTCFCSLDLMSFALAYRLDEVYDVKAAEESLWTTSPT